MININNRQEIKTKLDCLKENTPSLFGKMTAQHMVEHLTYSVMFSNGNISQKLYYSADKAKLIKDAIIYSDKQMPIGFKAPMLGDELLELRFPNLITSVSMLLSELDAFDKYFNSDQNAVPINPIMGELNKQEWITFHNKHFEHHFKQFKLI